MIDKTEKEIMQNWNSDDQMMVSITCVAYNHEYCIAKTLDSFLMQETNFSFEVIINDDASTDRTVDILKQYEDNFPEIIKPVYQSKNQFSQNINTMAILFPKTTGKYVAFCDGDDHWTDKEKLQIQVDEMEKEEYSEVDMCFHPTFKLVNDTKEEVLSKHSDKNKIFTPEEIILGGGVFCPTASLLFRSRLILSLPDWFNRALPGDYVTQIMGSVNGGALYIDRCMCVYRVGVASSWTSYTSIEDSKKRKNVLFSFSNKLELINDSMGKKFQTEIDSVIHDANLDFIKTRSIDVAAREEVYNLYKNTFSTKHKLLWYLLYRNQILLNVLRLIIPRAVSNP